MIIAELSANHNGNKQIAIDTIVAAKKSGADAVKLQTYTADTITVDCRADDLRLSKVQSGMELVCTIFISKPIPLGSGTKNCFVWPRRKDLSVFHHRLIKLR